MINWQPGGVNALLWVLRDHPGSDLGMGENKNSNSCQLLSTWEFMCQEISVEKSNFSSSVVFNLHSERVTFLVWLHREGVQSSDFMFFSFPVYSECSLSSWTAWRETGIKNKSRLAGVSQSFFYSPKSPEVSFTWNPPKESSQIANILIF